MQWSEETYRLDEIVDKFQLPCVIHVNEGYYSEDDSGNFSAGDILKIDQHLILHKVAANFVTDQNPLLRRGSESEYVSLSEKEILVPLKYAGKLRLINETKIYKSILNLVKDFPRYAKALENTQIENDTGGKLEIQSGTTIELDRLVPADRVRNKEAKLVITYESAVGQVYGAVPLSTRCSLRSEPDHNLYTLREVVDRYDLPRVVRFVGDEMKRVYTTDLMEGIENIKHFNADTLRLNRVVLQKVLVCYYKAPVEETKGVTSAPATEFCRRTLVLLPLDMQEIREIEVHVLHTSDDVEYVRVLFTNESRSAHMEAIDGSLYAEFARRPRLIKLSPGETIPAVVACPDEAPPIPPRRGTPGSNYKTPPKPVPKPTSPDYNDYLVPRRTVKTAGQSQEEATIEDSDSEYEYPEPPPPTHVTDPETNTSPWNTAPAGLGFSTIADWDFKSTDTIDKQKKQGKISGLAQKLQTKFGKLRRTTSVSAPKSPLSPGDTTSLPQYAHSDKRSPLPLPMHGDDIYDDIDDGPDSLPSTRNAIDRQQKNDDHQTPMDGNQAYSYQTNKTQTGQNPYDNNRLVNRPVAQVNPQNVARDESESVEIHEVVKPFDKLGLAELAERLRQCSMGQLADVCVLENVDGMFLATLSEEDLQMEPFSLSRFETIKLRQVKTNWIPR